MSDSNERTGERTGRLKVIVGAGASFPTIEHETRILEPLNAEIVDARGWSDAEVRAEAETADAIITDYFRCDAALIEKLTRCRIFASYGAGYDQIDVPAADAAGIVVTNNPDYCVDEVAEHAIALLLSSWRRICTYDAHVREGGWDYTAAPIPSRLRGSTLGIIGYGKIGRHVGELAAGLGMSVVVHDPYIPPDADGVDSRSLIETLAASDAVTVHLPLSSSTYHLIGEEELRHLPAHAGLINTARGGVIDEAAVARALNDGTLGWAALDALDTEPIDPASEMLRTPRTILTPHAAFYSKDSMAVAQSNAAEEVARVLGSGVALHPVGIVASASPS